MSIGDYVSNYVPQDGEQIMFAWNGRHGDDFRDSNLEFRREVLHSVLENTDSASLELLTALFEAETQYAKEAWSVHREIHILAQAMLIRGRCASVLDFLRGKLRSFDTSLGCARIQVSPNLSMELLQCCKALIEGDDEERRHLAQHGVEFFNTLRNRVE